MMPGEEDPDAAERRATGMDFGLTAEIDPESIADSEPGDPGEVSGLPVERRVIIPDDPTTLKKATARANGRIERIVGTRGVSGVRLMGGRVASVRGHHGHARASPKRWPASRDEAVSRVTQAPCSTRRLTISPARSAA